MYYISMCCFIFITVFRNTIMFVLFVFTTVAAVNLTEFKKLNFVYKPVPALLLTKFPNFLIDFKANTTEYLLFQGNDSIAYLHSRNSKFILWVIQNVSSYEVYTAAYTDRLIFGWSNYTINNKPMKRVLYEGSPIVLPMTFHSEIFMGHVNGVSTGSLDHPLNLFTIDAEIEDVYKCLPSSSWKMYMLTVLIVALVLTLLGVKHEFIKTLLGPTISGFIQRTRSLLSGGFEAVSRDNSETDSDVPEDPRRIHTTQTHS